MSVRLWRQVYEKELGASDQRVLLALCDHASDDGTNCYPSIKLLAWKLGVDRKTVMRAIGRLEKAGALLIDKQHRRNNRYTICLDAIPDKAPLDRAKVPNNGSRPTAKPQDVRDTVGPKEGQEATQQGPKSWDLAESPQVEPQPSVNRQMEPSEINRHVSSSGAKAPSDDANTVGAQSSPSALEPATPKDLIDAYTEASGKPFPVAAGKAIKMAKTMVKAGVTPDDVRGCVRWLMDDPWWQAKGFDWGTVVGHIDKWRGRPEPTAKPHTIRTEAQELDVVDFLKGEWQALDDGQLARLEAGEPLEGVLDDVQLELVARERRRRWQLADMMSTGFI